MEITKATQDNILNLLGLDALPLSEQEAVFSDLGTSIIETALLQFLTAQTEWEQQSFEVWVEEHASQSDMLEQLVTMYPSFGKIVTEEILLLQENFLFATI